MSSKKEEQTLGEELVDGLRELSEAVASGKPLSARFTVRTVIKPVMTEKKPKKPFMSGYKTYDDSQGHGSPDEWTEAFRVRMGFDEAVAVLGDDDPLMILGLVEVANAHLLRAFTGPEIKKAYLRMAKRWHPDMNMGDETHAESMFKKIQAAYVKLGGT